MRSPCKVTFNFALKTEMIGHNLVEINISLNNSEVDSFALNSSDIGYYSIPLKDEDVLRFRIKADDRDETYVRFRETSLVYDCTYYGEVPTSKLRLSL